VQGMLAVDMKEVKNSINVLCEYTDHELEAVYFAQDIYGAKKYLKPLVLALGILNSLFIIPDIYAVENISSIYTIIAARAAVLVIVLLLFLFVERIGSPYYISAMISVSELLCFGIFLVIFWAYPEPNILIQVLGLFIIILVVFIISNRWIYMIGISVIGAACFFLIAAVKFSDEPDWNAFSAGVTYTVLVILFSAYSSFRMNYYGRIHYLLNQELEKMSVTDPLTGLMNKSKLYGELNMWMNFSRRYKTPLSLILFDIDNFKQINDKYGHVVGDEVMVKVVNIIGSMIRETDAFARWGGDEFTIIMPHTGRVQALEITERLRKEISNTVFMPDFQVTCSFGVASLNNRIEHIDQFIYAADMALYKAKNSGRNVVMY
jgi:two-component system cell cycle response regulator